MAHPFDDGTAATLESTLAATAETLGCDASAYTKLMAPLVADWDKLAIELLGPLRRPRHPLALARFGLRAIRSARSLGENLFKGERARGFFAGLAAHSTLPLENPPTAAFGLVLAIAGHAVGWPIPRGGSQKISDALAAYLRSIGGEIVTGNHVRSLDELPNTRTVLLDVTPRQLVSIAGNRLPASYRSKLEKYRYGPGAYKMDWALDGPVPWKARECARAITVHLGGTMSEIAASEGTVWRGEHPERPFVLVAQQSLFDPTRAPAGKHTLWAYCHVPNGSTFDMSERIENQIERFAPGSATASLLGLSCRPRCSKRTTPTMSAATSTAGSKISGKPSCGPRLGSYPTRLQPKESTSARPQRLREAGCMACADTSLHVLLYTLVRDSSRPQLGG